MEILQEFLAYAGAFEKTLADDDWTRLRRYFADDAVYEVKSDALGCRLTGPDAIFKGMKKSLDGFDRKFAKRDINITSGPDMTTDGLRMGWEVTYKQDGWPPFVLRGKSEVRYAGGKVAGGKVDGGKIVYLCDSYEPSVEQDFAAWQRQSGTTLDPTYT